MCQLKRYKIPRNGMAPLRSQSHCPLRCAMLLRSAQLRRWAASER
jgi:hypothetical protein